MGPSARPPLEEGISRSSLRSGNSPSREMRRVLMYRVNRGLLGVGLAMLLFMVPGAFGQGSVGISMSNGGPYSMNGVYVGPYNATVNGQASQIICDDLP